jgi:hypothetical protein
MMQLDGLPGILLSRYASLAALLFACLAALDYQSIKLEELTDDSLSLFVFR